MLLKGNNVIAINHLQAYVRKVFQRFTGLVVNSSKLKQVKDLSAFCMLDKWSDNQAFASYAIHGQHCLKRHKVFATASYAVLLATPQLRFVSGHPKQ
mgnify:FL=1